MAQMGSSIINGSLSVTGRVNLADYLYGNVCGNLCGTATNSTKSCINNLTSTTTSSYNLLMSANTTAGYKVAYTSSSCAITFNPSTGVLTAKCFSGDIDSSKLSCNAVTTAGIVPAPTSSNANKVWGTDASGNPSWMSASSISSVFDCITVNGCCDCSYNNIIISCNKSTNTTACGNFFCAIGDTFSINCIYSCSKNGTSCIWNTSLSDCFCSIIYNDVRAKCNSIYSILSTSDNECSCIRLISTAKSNCKIASNEICARYTDGIIISDSQSINCITSTNAHLNINYIFANSEFRSESSSINCICSNSRNYTSNSCSMNRIIATATSACGCPTTICNEITATHSTGVWSGVTLGNISNVFMVCGNAIYCIRQTDSSISFCYMLAGGCCVEKYICYDGTTSFKSKDTVCFCGCTYACAKADIRNYTPNCATHAGSISSHTLVL